MLARRSHMLQVRRRERAFHPRAPQRILDLGPEAFALLRQGPDGVVVCVHEISIRGLTLHHRELARLASGSGGAVELLGGPARLPR